MTQIINKYNVINKIDFENKMKELTRRFKVEFEVAWGTPFSQKFEIYQEGESLNISVKTYPCEVTFSFGEFKVEGYQYLGAIKDSDMVGCITIHGKECTDGIDLVEFVESFKVIPCHACNRKHVRKIGHLFQNTETNKIIVLGSGCAKKYFGINFDRILGFFETLSTRYDDWYDGYINIFKSSYIDTGVLLRDIYYHISKYGYVSKSATIDPLDSTAYKVRDMRDHRQKVGEDVKDSVKGVDLSKVYEDRNIGDSPSEFDYNINIIREKMRNNLLSDKDLGWASYMVYSEFFKKEPVEKEVFHNPTDVEVGDKIENVSVILSGIKTFEGTYGTTNIFTFTTDGVRYKWFTQSDLCNKLDVDEGDEVVIKKATIKKLDVDGRYGESVIITRTSVIK